jgi:hypothetical protein
MKVKNITRKKKTYKKKNRSVMTIPQLRKAFDTIETETKNILQNRTNPIPEFQKLWKSVFHKSVDVKSAEAYLAMVKRSSRSQTQKKKQLGGSAPLDYMLRPGIDSSSYGNYLPYVNSGLGFYNQINRIAMDSDCGKQNISPVISADMGSNKVTYGGSLTEFLSQRPITATVPASPLQDLQDSLLGIKLGSSPDPLQARYTPR